MTLQYITLSKANGNLDMDGEYSFSTVEDALNAAYRLYKLGYTWLSIICVDTETGEPVYAKSRHCGQMANLMDNFEKQERAAEREDEIYGSYNQQHRQRVGDVV